MLRRNADGAKLAITRRRNDMELTVWTAHMTRIVAATLPLGAYLAEAGR